MKTSIKYNHFKFHKNFNINSLLFLIIIFLFIIDFNMNGNIKYLGNFFLMFKKSFTFGSGSTKILRYD